MVPFRVGFDEPAMGPMFWFETLIDVYFIVDLFLNFATAYYEEPDLKVGFVTDLKSIAVTYIRTWFPIDVLACLPIDYVTRASAGELECSFEVHGCASQEEEGVSGGQSVKLLKLLRIFRLLKLLRLARVSALMERYQDELIYWQNFITSVRVVLVTLFLSHWLAAYYGIIGLYGGDYGHLDAKGRYMRCFYNAISTITTLGAPDTANTQEELGGAVAMFVGATVFSWLLTNIFTVINPDDSTKMYKEKMDCVVNFLLVNKLPRATASQIIGFYRRQAETGFDEKALLANLPFSLRAEVFNILFRSTIKNGLGDLLQAVKEGHGVTIYAHARDGGRSSRSRRGAPPRLRARSCRRPTGTPVRATPRSTPRRAAARRRAPARPRRTPRPSRTRGSRTA